MSTQLERWFPLVRTLGSERRIEFAALADAIAAQPNFDLRLFAPGRRELRVPVDSVRVAAGHVAELFFHRRDILAMFLSRPRHIWLYDSARAYEDDGGVMGGQFDPARGAVMLVQSRLQEGMLGEWPGVAPFLHEFGHMLDFLDPATGAYGASHGLLPGLALTDGRLYTPAARAAFARGKHLEIARYREAGAADARQRARQALPLGHPYVFQNDTEFCAGYLEMWFRNPNAIASQNPDLHQGYAALFGWDARAAWPQDFGFYSTQNRAFYLGGSAIWASQVTEVAQ